MTTLLFFLEGCDSEYLSVIFFFSKEKFNYIAHTQKSGYHFCNDYYNVISKSYDKTSMSEDRTHIIANGLHCHDVFSYLWFILANGETCVLSESTLDVWRASFLDRIAGIIDRYHVSTFFTGFLFKYLQ